MDTPLALLLLMLLVLLVAPGVALASSREVIRDCAEDGDLDRRYSQEDLEKAYGKLPAIIDQHTDCRSAIEKARERSEADAPQARVDGSGETLESNDGSGGAPASLLVAIILAALTALAGLLHLFRNRLPQSIASRRYGRAER